MPLSQSKKKTSPALRIEDKKTEKLSPTLPEATELIAEAIEENDVETFEEAIPSPQPQIAESIADDVQDASSSQEISPAAARQTTAAKARRSANKINLIQSKPVVKIYSGQVKNQNGQAIENAVIQAFDTDSKTLSNFNGSFQLHTDTMIDYLRISKSGYYNRWIPINEYSNRLDVTLTGKLNTPLSDFSNAAEGISVTPSLPRPKGGFTKFERYIKNNLRYPEEANKEGIEAEIEVRFFILEDGTLSDFQTLDNQNVGFEKEAIRLLKEGPIWKPSNSEGRYVVKFQLRN